MLSLGLQGNLGRMSRHLLLDDSFKHFANNRGKAHGPELIGVLLKSG